MSSIESPLMGGVRTTRIMQLSAACFFIMLFAAYFGTGTTKIAILLTALAMALTFAMAYFDKAALSSSILLFSLTGMFSYLTWLSGGIRDIAMLGFPMMLMLAAMLGNRKLLVGVYLFIVSYCALITFLTVTGQFKMVLPTVTPAHFVYVAGIFTITTLGVYWLTADSRRLTANLQAEHNKALKREKTITNLANHDQLTGLCNRRFIEQEFEPFMDKAKKERCFSAVFFIDLDAFKPVNDSLSHAAGDQVLIGVANRITALSQESDLACRFGGDEFLLLVARPIGGVDEDAELLQIANDILSEIKKPYVVMDTIKVEISASIGIAKTAVGDSFMDAVRSADLAMYDAKDKGRNTVSFFTPDLITSSQDKFKLAREMRKALKTGGFQLWYQPKIDIKTRKVIGCESLIRWPQSDGSFIYPDAFIPVAESSGLVNELGLWVLERACKDCAKWRSSGFDDVKVAVNVSYIQLREGLLPSHVRAIISKTNLPSDALEIELTESLFVADSDGNHRQLKAIFDMGVSIAIDDFGTGYSNLGYLRRFNARCLKIDRSFIKDLGENENNESLVRAIIQMAHSLGLRVIAEGIEDEKSLNKLHDLGCDEGQGFLWSPAMPFDKWMTFLQENQLA